MKRTQMRRITVATAVLLTLAAAPAAAHKVDIVPVRNGVEASALYDWNEVGFVSIRVVEGSIAFPGDTGKKAAKGSPRELVTVTAYGPKTCDLDALTVRTRLMHGSRMTDDPDGTAGIAVFDEDHRAVVNGVVSVHVHDELWTIAEDTPPDFLCHYDDEPGGERWVLDFVLLDEDSYYFSEDMDVDARWEHVEIAPGQGKGKKKPRTELLHEASFAIDLDSDGVDETPGTADDVQADLGAIPRGLSIPYFHEQGL